MVSVGVQIDGEDFQEQFSVFSKKASSYKKLLELSIKWAIFLPMGSKLYRVVAASVQRFEEIGCILVQIKHGRGRRDILV